MHEPKFPEQTIPAATYTITIIKPGDAAIETRQVQAPERKTRALRDGGPGYDWLRQTIEPIVAPDGRTHFEHVSVLHNDERADMFVNDSGHVPGMELPFNATATGIYRANWLKQHLETPPDSLPWIAGIAVLFPVRVWY